MDHQSINGQHNILFQSTVPPTERRVDADTSSISEYEFTLVILGPSRHVVGLVVLRLASLAARRRLGRH